MDDRQLERGALAGHVDSDDRNSDGSVDSGDIQSFSLIRSYFDEHFSDLRRD